MVRIGSARGRLVAAIARSIVAASAKGTRVTDLTGVLVHDRQIGIRTLRPMPT